MKLSKMKESTSDLKIKWGVIELSRFIFKGRLFSELLEGDQVPSSMVDTNGDATQMEDNEEEPQFCFRLFVVLVSGQFCKAKDRPNNNYYHGGKFL